MSKCRSESFYAEHKEKFFYNRLVTFMSSGPIHVHILLRRDAIKEWRRIMGPTKVYKARYESPHTIRGQCGLSDTRNVAHGSDSETTARTEIAFFFPDFDMEDYVKNEERAFQAGDVTFDWTNFVHRVRP